MSDETEDLLYTQEDMMRTNDELMDHIFDLKQRIAELEEEKKEDGRIFANEMKVQDDENKTLLNRNRDLTTKIVNLSNENTKLKTFNELCHNDLRSKIDCIYEQDEVINYYKEENAKLQEQLKNAFAPKFKHHKIVYAVANTDILKGQIDVFDIYQKKYLVHFYGIDDINSFGDMWCYENELFATEVEAQKHLLS